VESRGGNGANVGDDDDGVVYVMERLPLCQRGVNSVDGCDFPPVAVADQPFQRWKKGSDFTAATENYGKNRAYLFSQNEGVHKKMETRRPSRARRAWVAWSA
jgi:hypothetical protein